MRRGFASGGGQVGRALEKRAPAGVVGLIDEPYGDAADTVLDLYRPASATEPLPLVLWVHGGGFIGGSKEELGGYFKLVASAGYTVAAPRYSLAPKHRYPTPTRQVMQALAYLHANAERLQLDPHRIVIGGDSAGAQIAAQIGELVTTPGYPEAVGVEPTITTQQLRGLVLACGAYDLGLAGAGDLDPVSRCFLQTTLWAYSGRRDYARDPLFATLSVTDHVTAAFPPALITVGNADPLRAHTELLIERLRAQGVKAETVLYPGDHDPPLGHEYQFDLDADAGQAFLRRMLSFLGARLGEPPPGATASIPRRSTQVLAMDDVPGADR